MNELTTTAESLVPDLGDARHRLPRPGPAVTGGLLNISVAGRLGRRLGAADRHASLWNRRRVIDTAVRLLCTGQVSVEGMLDRQFSFADARRHVVGQV